MPSLPRPPRPAAGLVVAGVLVVAAAVVPAATGTDVGAGTAPPLQADWAFRVGPGTAPALAVAVVAATGGLAGPARRLGWGRLLLATWVLGVVWMLSLALVDGVGGLGRVLDSGTEYLQTARSVDDVGAALRHFVARIPFTRPDHWAVHVAGHPPGALLLFVLLDRLGLGSGLAAGLAVVLLAATTPLGVAVTCRALGAEADVRRALPVLVLGPFALWQAVSADGVFAATAAWGLAALALAARGGQRASAAALWSLLAGLLLGGAVLLSYGLLLLGPLAAAVLLAARRWRPLPVVAAGAAGIVLAFAHLGYRYWEALPVLRERYWAGIASERPNAYWVWADLAVLVLSAGPVLAAALAWSAPRIPALLRAREPLTTLAAGACLAVVAADLSLMSKAEVERIWLPFVPWLLLLAARLPPRWLSAALALQVALAVILQHVLRTPW